MANFIGGLLHFDPHQKFNDSINEQTKSNKSIKQSRQRGLQVHHVLKRIMRWNQTCAEIKNALRSILRGNQPYAEINTALKPPDTSVRVSFRGTEAPLRADPEIAEHTVLQAILLGLPFYIRQQYKLLRPTRTLDLVANTEVISVRPKRFEEKPTQVNNDSEGNEADENASFRSETKHMK